MSNPTISHMKDRSWHSGAFCYPGRQKTTLKSDNSIQNPIRSNCPHFKIMINLSNILEFMKFVAYLRFVCGAIFTCSVNL